VKSKDATDTDRQLIASELLRRSSKAFGNLSFFRSALGILRDKQLLRSEEGASEDSGSTKDLS
jgi:hypothetical protein